MDENLTFALFAIAFVAFLVGFWHYDGMIADLYLKYRAYWIELGEPNTFLSRIDDLPAIHHALSSQINLFRFLFVTPVGFPEDKQVRSNLIKFRICGAIGNAICIYLIAAH